VRSTIGIPISTKGRPSLKETLGSVRDQGLEPGDRVLVIFDGPPEVGYRDLVASFGPQFESEVRPTRNPREYGHGQLNYALDKLRGTVDSIVYQDDDDVFTPGAFDALRAHRDANPDHLIMARVDSHVWGLLWREPNFSTLVLPDDEDWKDAGIFALDGHCVVMPGRAPILPKHALYYNGDQVYAQTANLLFHPNVIWCKKVISLTRPHERAQDTALQYAEHACD
jgi:hypothetical protein